jgi:hypothetical protein
MLWMKHIIAGMLTAFVTVLLQTTALANEVGNRMFVTAPKAPPIHTTKSGTKYWPCNGFVNPKLIDIIFEDLKAISAEERIPAPSNAICHYKISNMQLMGNNITMYSVDFYTGKANMETCVIRDYCTDFRSMTFKIKNEKLHRQYMVTNLNKKLTRMQCVDMKGQIVGARNGC